MINKLENKFENLKERFSKEQIVLIFAKFECEDILEEIDVALSLLAKLSNDDEMKRRFIALNKQVKEFDEFLTDLISSKTTSL